MQAVDCRRTFPCFDEPALKAVFGITVTAPAHLTVISNSHALRVETSRCGRNRTHVFADTPKMSSYLTAAVVGELDRVSRLGSDGILTSVYTPQGKAALGEFALDVGVRSLELFARLFDVPYIGAAKLDHVAVPAFAAGALHHRIGGWARLGAQGFLDACFCSPSHLCVSHFAALAPSS